MENGVRSIETIYLMKMKGNVELEVTVGGIEVSDTLLRRGEVRGMGRRTKNNKHTSFRPQTHTIFYSKLIYASQLIYIADSRS